MMAHVMPRWRWRSGLWHRLRRRWSSLRMLLISRRNGPCFPEAHFADAGCDVEARIAFNTAGLQRDGLVEATEPHVLANATADRHGRGCTGVVALERARPDIGGRSHVIP